MENLNIRKIEEKDLKKLSEIYNEVYKRFDIGEKWTVSASYDMLKYWSLRQPDLCFLAELDKKIVGGFVVGIKPWWDGNHLVDGEIFVHVDYQKKGIGKELLRFVLDYAIKKYNVVKFDTYTVKDKYPLNWYKRLGFKEIKEWEMITADPREIIKKL
jgi:ribosomal protein S18 acetylase RimI-like enzyme